MLSFLHKHIHKNGYELWDIAFQEQNMSHKKYVFPKKDKINVLLTMTTCKRFTLFEKTIQSILHTWTDLDQVDAWFCVDDNSSEEDRIKMKQMNWIEYYMKNETEKGHRTSMNIIWNKLKEVQPTYWIHIEDDFQFHVERSYVMDAIRGLKIVNAQQLIYNRNYGETIHDYRIQGHISVTEEFCIHDYKEGTFSYSNCHYWPHFSFRPGMTKVDVILQLGNFESPNTFFEMDYAQRWENAGYKTCFFNQITCQHIGKLTKDTITPNAYQLNHCEQFSSFVKVINLERRPDRKERMQTILKGIPHEFIKAVDGKLLRPTEEMRCLFEKNDYGSRKSFMGCALSHYQLWKQLLTDTKEYYFIMEDDVTVCKDFSNKLYSLDTVMRKNDFCFLGYHMFSKYRDESYNVEKEPILQPLQEKYIGGFFAYSIHKQGAKKMIDYIEKNGIQHGIDYLIKIVPVNCIECYPHLAFSVWNEGGKEIDTDIQMNYETMEWDYVFIKGFDQHGEDLIRVKSNILKNCNSVGVNTLGFIKKKINVHQLKPSIYFGEQDGIYIKKEYYDLQKIIRVKMLCNWCSSEQLCKEWSNMCESNFTWGHIQITWKEPFDYYVVINSTNEYHEPEKTIVFQMEPWVYDESKPWGVKTWGIWSNPTGYMHVHDRKTYVNNVFWQLEQTYSQWLDMNIEKTNNISSICSSKYFDEGHILRIDLLKLLDQRINIDIYNEDNTHQFKQWKGPVTPYVNKSKGMLPYRYYVMMENNFEHNFITEKLWEPILCETLCFYYGCPNVSDHIDPRAYVLLDKDLETSYQIIEKAIKEDWYSIRLPYIQKVKMDLLYRMSFFPTLNHIIQTKKRVNLFTEKFNRVCFLHNCKGISVKCIVDLVLKQEFDKIFIVNGSHIVHPKIQMIEYVELETLNLLRTFAENQECDILYLDADNSNILLVENTEECVEKLKTYDVVGIKSNFWSKTSYLRTLRYVSISHESWIISNHQCKLCSMYSCYPK